MLHSLLVLAAEEAEPSKTAFYVGGGAFAAFAVALGALGMTQPDFPSEGAAKGVAALAFVLMVATMATAVITG